MNTNTKKKNQLPTAQYYLTSNNPDKTYESCKKALDPFNTLLTGEQEKEWIALLQQAETAIVQRRKTNPSYASHITLSLAETSIDQRTVKQETIISSSQTTTPECQPESSSNTIKITASERIINNALSAQCSNYIKCDELDKIDSLCTKQLQLLLNESLNKDQTPSSQNLLLRKQLESLQGWLNLIQQNSYQQALLFTETELIRIKKENPSNQPFEVSVKTNDSLKQSASQNVLWHNIYEYTDGIINASNSIMDQLLNPKPQTNINWDRFSQTPFLNHFRYINQDTYPDLYKIALEGRDQVNYEMKRRVISLVCGTAILALATSITLYLNGYTSSLESKLLAIPIFLCGLLLTMLYTLVAGTWTEEKIIEKMRNTYKLEAKQK